MAKPKGHSVRFHNIAVELGYINIYWGWIETAVDWAISELIPLKEEDVANAVCGNSEIRSKLQMLKALAFIRQPSKEWFDCMTEILDAIDNDLRARRNAAVHASWHTPQGRVTRIRKKTRVHRPQAFQLVLSTIERLPVKIGELRKLRVELLRTLKALMYAVRWALNPERQAIPARQYLRQITSWDRRLGGDAELSPPSRPSRK